MIGRLKGLGLILAVLGLAFMAGGAYAFIRTQEGVRSLQAFSAAQDIKLTYNEQGVLVDRGEPAGAAVDPGAAGDGLGLPGRRG